MNRKKIFQILILGGAGATLDPTYSLWTYPYQPAYCLRAKVVQPAGTGAREGTLLSMSQQ